jgi:hypothetical protein
MREFATVASVELVPVPFEFRRGGLPHAAIAYKVLNLARVSEKLPTTLILT